MEGNERVALQDIIRQGLQPHSLLDGDLIQIVAIELSFHYIFAWYQNKGFFMNSIFVYVILGGGGRRN